MRACLVTASPRLARLVPDLYMLPLTSTRNRNCFFSPSLEWGSPARDALGVGMRATCEQSFRVSSRLGGGPALRGVCTRCAPRPATKEEVDIKPKQSQIRILSSTARSLQVLSWNLHSHSLTHSLTRFLPEHPGSNRTNMFLTVSRPSRSPLLPCRRRASCRPGLPRFGAAATPNPWGGYDGCEAS